MNGPELEFTARWMLLRNDFCAGCVWKWRDSHWTLAPVHWLLFWQWSVMVGRSIRVSALWCRLNAKQKLDDTQNLWMLWVSFDSTVERDYNYHLHMWIEHWPKHSHLSMSKAMLHRVILIQHNLLAATQSIFVLRLLSRRQSAAWEFDTTYLT